MPDSPTADAPASPSATPPADVVGLRRALQHIAGRHVEATTDPGWCNACAASHPCHDGAIARAALSDSSTNDRDRAHEYDSPVFDELTPPYSTIVVDPPWHYDGFATMPGNAKKSGHKTKRVDMPYGSMTLNEIRSLPVASIAAKDCFLFLWTTNRYLFYAESVAEAWGFTYRQTLVWHKTGNPSPFGGTVAPNHAEFLIVGTRGTPVTKGRLAGSVLSVAKPYQHSLKPPAFLDAIEVVAEGPYVELFARAPRLGWDSWGKGYEIGAAS